MDKLGPVGVNRMQNTSTLSYTYLDNILDHMLAEVDKQEQLVNSETEQFKPACVNTINLTPSRNNFIELPISKADIPKQKNKTSSSKLNLFTLEQIEISRDPILLDTYPYKEHSELLSTFFLTPSEDVVIELPPSGSTRSNTKKRMSHVNSYDFGPIENNNKDQSIDPTTSLIDEEEIFKQIPDLGVLDELENPNSQNIWWEGTYRNLNQFIKPENSHIYEEEKQNFLDNYYPNYEKDKKFYYVYNEISTNSSDDYDSTDSDEPNIQPVKADVKLLVKTTDNGKEEIEIRSIKEVLSTVKQEPKSFKRSNSSSTLPKSYRVPFNSTEVLKNNVEKPTFTLQRLFIRSPGFEPGFVTKNNSLLSSKTLSRSQPELVASSNIKYPLEYEATKPVDLHANTPFYPCYDQYSKHYDLSDSLGTLNSEPITHDYTTSNYDAETFPSAYCDWLLPSETETEGKVDFV